MELLEEKKRTEARLKRLMKYRKCREKKRGENEEQFKENMRSQKKIQRRTQREENKEQFKENMWLQKNRYNASKKEEGFKGQNEVKEERK